MIYIISSEVAEIELVSGRLMKVINWSTCTEHTIRFSMNFDDFKCRVLEAFFEECTTVHVSLFKVSGNDPVDQRARITSESFILDSLDYFSKCGDLVIYFFNSLESPQGSPQSRCAYESLAKKSCDTRSSTSRSSHSSRSTPRAMEVKNRDGYTCVFCGSTNREFMSAAHLLAINSVPDFADELGKKAFFKRYGIIHANDPKNMITLCLRQCHFHFDKHDIGFTRDGVWAVRDTIANDIIRGELTYGQFAGKDLMLCQTIPDALIQHRAELYEMSTEDRKLKALIANEKSNGIFRNQIKRCLSKSVINEAEMPMNVHHQIVNHDEKGNKDTKKHERDNEDGDIPTKRSRY